SVAAQPPLDRARPEGSGIGRGGAPHREGRRCDHRRVPPRRDGTVGAGAGRAAGRQSAAGIRPHDRLGPDRADGAAAGPRHQLYRDLGRAPRAGPRGREADAADQPGGRFRRRGDVPGVRDACGAAPRAAHRRGAGSRCRDDRRLG
ncbi:hypothetical protein LTR94_033164, partial [Friedmanniomyces endolithicus]